jgi:hypothetical protein
MSTLKENVLELYQTEPRLAAGDDAELPNMHSGSFSQESSSVSW